MTASWARAAKASRTVRAARNRTKALRMRVFIASERLLVMGDLLRYFSQPRGPGVRPSRAYLIFSGEILRAQLAAGRIAAGKVSRANLSTGGNASQQLIAGWRFPAVWEKTNEFDNPSRKAKSKASDRSVRPTRATSRSTAGSKTTGLRPWTDECVRPYVASFRGRRFWGGRGCRLRGWRWR